MAPPRCSSVHEVGYFFMLLPRFFSTLMRLLSSSPAAFRSPVLAVCLSGRAGHQIELFFSFSGTLPPRTRHHRVSCLDAPPPTFKLREILTIPGPYPRPVTARSDLYFVPSLLALQRRRAPVPPSFRRLQIQIRAFERTSWFAQL